MRTLRLLPFVFAFVTGCSSPPPADVPAGCNPLIGDDCTTPFPSSFFETTDATSPTGVRVSVAANVWPATATGIAFRGDQVENRDGFSPATPFVVYFKAGVDPAQLPPATPISAPRSRALGRADHRPRRQARACRSSPSSTPTPIPRSAIARRCSSAPWRAWPAGDRYVIALVGLHDAKGSDARPRAASARCATRPRSPRR